MKTLAFTLAILGAVQSGILFFLAVRTGASDSDFLVRMLSLALASFLFPLANVTRLAGKR